MTTTIPESKYLDCVEELNAKLADERKLNSDKNARIAELEEHVAVLQKIIMRTDEKPEDLIKYRKLPERYIPILEREKTGGEDDG